MNSRTETEMRELILQVAAADERILAVLQDGSRSNPNVTPDIFQDYDIIYVVESLAPFQQDPSWIGVFGETMIVQLPEDMELYPPSPELEGAFSYLMQFTDGNRIDLVLVTPDNLESFLQDSLCKVLWDKSGLFTDRPLPAPSDTSYWVEKPTERSYTDCCNEFWYTNAGLAKGLWRGEIILVQELMNQVIRGALMQMMDWYIGSKHSFAVNPGKFGKYYQRYMEPELYRKMLATYPEGAGLPQLWHAVYATIDLFGHAASAVGEQLGYTYPSDWERNVSTWLRHVQKLPEGAGRVYGGELE